MIYDQPRSCPACGKVVDAATGVTDPDAQPKSGDVTICIYCRSVLVFTEHGLRYPEDDELVEFMRDPDFRRAVTAVSQLHRHRVIEP